MLAAALLVGCDANNQCVTPQGCGPQMLCVANECVGTAVEGDRWALYLREFRVRLDADCGICHFAGANDAEVVQDDGAWRLHSGANLSLAQIEANYLDVQDFLSAGDPQLSPLVAYGRGLFNVQLELEGPLVPHPAIWSSRENLGYERVLNWLAQFPEVTAPADEPPLPPMVSDPGGGLDGYRDGIHAVLATGCSCHGAPNREWVIAGATAEEAEVDASYEATLAFVELGDPDASLLLTWALGEEDAGHTYWTADNPNAVAVAEWIRKTTTP